MISVGFPTPANRSQLGARLLVVAAVAVLGFALLVSGARSGSSDSASIAFTRYDGIYTMKADGTDSRPIRTGGVGKRVIELEWSPDGRKLAFAGWSGAEGGIWTMDADGANLVRVVRAPPYAGLPTSVSWSPNGRRLAWVGDGGIWVVNTDGGNRRLLVRIARPDLYVGAELDWSPDGSRFVFTTGGWVPLLYVVDANGSSLHQIKNATPRGFWVHQPEWSPNGRRIAFTRATTTWAEIFVTDPSGRSTVQVTETGYFDFHPAWSPDGRRIAFVRGIERSMGGMRHPAKKSTREIYVVHADGTDLMRLTHSRFEEALPAWQPVAAR